MRLLIALAAQRSRRGLLVQAEHTPVALRAAKSFVLALARRGRLHLDPNHGADVNWHLPRNLGKRPAAQAVRRQNV